MKRREFFGRWLKRTETDAGESVSRPPAGGWRGVQPQPQLPPFLRPPGAADEPDFLRLCEQCLSCRDACPYEAILVLGPAYGEADGTPAVMPPPDACETCEDQPCNTVCPTGALTPETT